MKGVATMIWALRALVSWVGGTLEGWVLCSEWTGEVELEVLEVRGGVGRYVLFITLLGSSWEYGGMIIYFFKGAIETNGWLHSICLHIFITISKIRLSKKA